MEMEIYDNKMTLWQYHTPLKLVYNMQYGSTGGG